MDWKTNREVIRLTILPHICHTSPKINRGGVVMSGSIWKQGDRYFVGFYHTVKGKRVQAKIGYYKGEKMFHKSIARKCLSQVQSRYEDYIDGKCQFDIAEFTGRRYTDVGDYYEQWMQNVIEPKRKPATIKGYWSYYRNWIEHSLATVKLDSTKSSLIISQHCSIPLSCLEKASSTL